MILLGFKSENIYKRRPDWRENFYFLLALQKENVTLLLNFINN